jgi:hypothetical protein
MRLKTIVINPFKITTKDIEWLTEDDRKITLKQSDDFYDCFSCENFSDYYCNTWKPPHYGFKCKGEPGLILYKNKCEDYEQRKSPHLSLEIVEYIEHVNYNLKVQHEKNTKNNNIH